MKQEDVSIPYDVVDGNESLPSVTKKEDFFLLYVPFLKANINFLYFSIEVMIPDTSFRVVVAAAEQDVFGREASKLEIIPLALTAVTDLAIIWDSSVLQINPKDVIETENSCNV
ncbi:hypothetical protein BTVI_104531 [Pitangus sulphuratus]|nr:hypothetical protein BTVI_104531 [Pitangus sulphuratus]